MQTRMRGQRGGYSELQQCVTQPLTLVWLQASLTELHPASLTELHPASLTELHPTWQFGSWAHLISMMCMKPCDATTSLRALSMLAALSVTSAATLSLMLCFSKTSLNRAVAGRQAGGQARRQAGRHAGSQTCE
jgi:hypothetical protein